MPLVPTCGTQDWPCWTELYISFLFWTGRVYRVSTVLTPSSVLAWASLRRSLHYLVAVGGERIIPRKPAGLVGVGVVRRGARTLALAIAIVSVVVRPDLSCRRVFRRGPLAGYNRL